MKPWILVSLAVLALTPACKKKSATKAQDAGVRAMPTAEEAATAFDAACVKGDAEACRNLGVLYAEGTGVARDPVRALALYGQACDRGNAAACNNLGLVLLQGHGVQPDPVAARRWFGKACDEKSLLGCRNLGLTLVRGEGGDKDPAAALAVFQKTCDDGLVLACTNAAQVHAAGEGVARDLGAAVKLYQQACEGGDPAGCRLLGGAYLRGEGVPAGAAAAAMWLGRACDRNDAYACAVLGALTRDGKGVAQDAAKAEALAKVNVELERANRDLEEFASVISHDLKAPLRGVHYYVGDLEAALAGGNAGEARQCLTRVANQVRRMSEMLNGLLAYSRVGRKNEMVERVDLRALALEIAGAIASPPGFVIDVAEGWPVIDTLRAPFDLVLRNLVENAVKHHDRPIGRVEISAVDNGMSVMLAVADDGPGIPPEWHEAIFQPFRRIGSDDAVEGSGIGLALVKKTVEMVGGRVEVESRPGARRGTIFRVAWPKVIRV